jgi:hypothetical protein
LTNQGINKLGIHGFTLVATLLGSPVHTSLVIKIDVVVRATLWIVDLDKGFLSRVI